MNNRKTFKSYYLSERFTGCIAYVASQAQITEGEALEMLLRDKVNRIEKGINNQAAFDTELEETIQRLRQK